MLVKLLCVGDIVGRPGRQMLADHLVHLVKEHDIDCTIVNAENVAGGSGLTNAIYDKLIKYGVNLITLGDHVYRKREIVNTLNSSSCIVRPANLSPLAAGKEYAIYQTKRGPKVAVITILGRMYMSMPGDNPLIAIDRILQKLPPGIDIVVVEIHAEATSEKICMGWHLDGRVSAVFGTHTHVTTADETVLPKGTAYITDLGMTGPHKSVLGRDIERVLQANITQMPFPFSIATEDLRLNGIIVTVESLTGRAVDIQRVCICGTHEPGQAYDEDDGKPDNYNNH